MDLELRSVVCVPLVKMRAGSSTETGAISPMNDTLGLLYMDSRAGAADLSLGNRELLETLALEASTILENARLMDADRQRQRMQEELRIAHRIQESLLPK
jgi:GAF domain-containing protein